MNIIVRAEKAADVEAIGRLIEAAFQNARYSSHTEQFIVNALRRCSQLTISLVAVDSPDDRIVGHVAISPVAISSGAIGWYGLGPISVLPNVQGRGIGSMLMSAAVAELQKLGAAGCVLLGDPLYYGRFGFKRHPGFELPGVPPEFFQALPFGVEVPVGIVRYHEAFEATG